MEATIVNKKYPLWLWLTSITIAAVIIWIIQIITGGGEQSWIPIIIVMGLVYSIPVFLICYFSYRILSKKIFSATKIKILIALISIAGLFITLLVSDLYITKLVLIYSGSIILSSVIFKVYKKEEISN